jgi:hypothetical protein
MEYLKIMFLACKLRNCPSLSLPEYDNNFESQLVKPHPIIVKDIYVFKLGY